MIDTIKHELTVLKCMYVDEAIRCVCVMCDVCVMCVCVCVCDVCVMYVYVMCV